MKNIVCLFAFFCMFNLSAEVKIRPLPWFTEGAIAFLKEHLEKHPESRILEYGSGASTIYLASRVCELVSVEHDPKWHKLIKGRIEKLPFPTTHIKCVLRKRPYNNIASEFPNEYFDLILVDGRDRVKCIESSLSKLKKGGGSLTR
jgi:predicted O-methyltransferase YrrM